MRVSWQRCGAWPGISPTLIVAAQADYLDKLKAGAEVVPLHGSAA